MPRTLLKLPFFVDTVTYAKCSDFNRLVLEALNNDDALEQYVSKKMDIHKQPARNEQQAFVRKWAKSAGLDQGIPDRIRQIIYELRDVPEKKLAFKYGSSGIELLQPGSRALPKSNFEIYFVAKSGEVVAQGRDEILAWIPGNESPNPLGLFLTYEVDEIYLKKPIVN